ncbi:HET-domain-containing protein [Cubamyces sp. BRFM 1775]|nr:HET-domain-containing protein [Cubamyces sp. BRFM 1775]
MASSLRLPMICATAWERVITSQYALLCGSHYRHQPGESEYTISSVLWLKCAQSGCLWCLFLANQYLKALKRQTDEWPIEKVHVQFCAGPNCMPVVECGIYPRSAIVTVNGLKRTYELYTIKGDPAAKWITRRTLIPHVGWPYALDLAKAYIEECIRDHPECRAITPHPIGSAPLPSRLVDCSDPNCLHIVEPAPGTGGRYIALSYVWGAEAPCYRTTKANLSSYKIKIDSTILPQTIHDAIHVTRALGVRFLWIDGLCIIQDSEGDKYHELEHMRDVYRHAFLTIDAGSAASVSEGFLQNRRIHPKGATILPFICPRDPGGTFGQGEPTREAQIGMVYWVCMNGLGHYPMSFYTESDSLSLRDGKPTAHTAQRGWCLQERLLSTRSLIFTTQTLQFRCHSLTQNVGGAHHDDSNDVPRLPNAIFHPNQHVARGSGEWNHIHGRWLKIVEDYSCRKLSDPSDKLTAISALAEMFAPILGPEYAAGLWRRTLLEDLLWEPQSSDSGSSRPRSSHPSGYRAPSWSWASADAPVRFWSNTAGVPLAELVENTLILQNEKLPFGRVIGGSLVLSASLWQCRQTGHHGDEIEFEIHPYSSFAPKPFTCTARISYKEDVAVKELWIIPIMQIGIMYNTMQGLVVTREAVDVWRGAEVGPRRQGLGEVYRRVAICSFGDLTAKSEYMVHGIPRVNIELV